MMPTRVTRFTFVLLVGMAVLVPDGTPILAASARTGALEITKECSLYFGQAGQFCTLTSSSLSEIAPGARVYYTQPANIPAGVLDSNVVLDAGNGNRALGRCTLDLVTFLGLCTFSDGTGLFAGFHARVDVFPPGYYGNDWFWKGTYGFTPGAGRQ